MTNIIFAIVTAYCPCVKCCGPNAAGIFADGTRYAQSAVAAPRRYPFGTVVFIDGRRYIVRDRTAVRFDKRFDIAMRSHKEAIAFGKQKKQITIITK